MQIAVPGTNATITAAEINGRPMVALKPMCEAIGIDDRSQRRKLQAKAWATGVIMTSVAEDGKSRDMYMIDRRTMTMWLATIDESRVNEDVRPTVIAFQNEAADALDSYFHDGGAINPSATEDQLERLARQAQAQANVLQALKGIVDPKHLEAKGRVVLARALGEKPELDPTSIPLYVSDYLSSKGLDADLVTAKAPGFGKRLKGLYVAEHGEAPGKAYQELPNGTVREVYAYTQADRHLFDQVWNRHYEGVVKAVRR
ncbi:phage antirepressor N-terminal domain-containing protein [Rhodococcus sp. Z13]|uniref:Phage antirepressor N-terminal domain-containing protein n=1 Tax=Rhodococcus sacchari TaxID=2962047 RepID=A0ACD4DCP2_9NOCA|nr:phage antirepressor N-terminal domain-containing protein [Rhodococcus sp. Z13]UYP17746.1 phage antirepressor N-terminal domain-containing protein [Rhodococcus sp. Z13]